MGVVIKITDSKVSGDLDLYDSSLFPLVVTKAVSNIDNLQERNGTFSKTFKVPATKNNNVLLGHIYNINQRKDTKDILDKKTCRISVDGIEVESGFIRILSVIGNTEPVEYEIVFFGDNIDWVNDVDDFLVKDVTYRNATQVLNINNVKQQHGKTIATDDFNYPYVGRGLTSDPTQLTENDFRPCVYLKSIIERGLNQKGWNLNSDFMDTANFQKLVCDLSGAFEYNEATLNQSKTKVGLSPNQGPFSGPYLTQIIWNDESGKTSFEDSNNNNSTLTGLYTAPFTGSYKLDLYVETTVDNVPFTCYIRKNIDLVTLAGTDIKYTDYPGVGKGNTVGYVAFNETFALTAGDTIAVIMQPVAGGSITVNTNSYYDISLAATVTSGGTYTLNNVLPNDISVLNIINDTARFFNLYFWTDIRTKTVYMEPRDDFYSAEADAIDWTGKLSLTPNYEISFISDYKRALDIRYKPDSNDKWLERWERVNGIAYTEYDHDLGTRFPKGTDQYTTEVFSPTYTIHDENSTPDILLDEKFVTARIWQEYKPQDDPPPEVEDYNPRLYNYVYATQADSNGVNRQYTIDSQIVNQFPAAITESYDTVTAPINLNFAGDDGLIDTYWLKTFATIRNASRIVAYFKLTVNDVQNFDFRKLVRLDAPSNLSGVYVVEKIEDFNYVNPGLTKVTLLEYKNFGKDTLGTGGTNNPKDALTKVNEEPNPIYVNDNGEIKPLYTNINGDIDFVFKNVSDA